MQNKFMTTPTTFPVIMKENMILFVVLEHINNIRWSNLIKQKVTNKEQLVFVKHEWSALTSVNSNRQATA